MNNELCNIFRSDEINGNAGVTDGDVAIHNILNIYLYNSNI